MEIKLNLTGFIVFMVGFTIPLMAYAWISKLIDRRRKTDE